MNRETAPQARGAAERAPRRRSEVLSLLAVLLVLLGVAVNTVSCGNDDLIFPGDIPFTPTEPDADPTDTPDPDDDV